MQKESCHVHQLQGIFLRRSFQIATSPATLLFILGAIAITGYAPFHFYPATIFALAGLFHFWQKARSGKQAAWWGFSFGSGFFCAGTSWIYVSLHVYGGMPLWMGAFATFAFCEFLALFIASAGWLTFKSSKPLVAGPILWVLFEWIKSWIFTGFPWLNVGYSQVPNSPLAGFAPILGIYGVSLLVAFTAILMLLITKPSTRRPALIAFILLWVGSSILKHINWTQPVGEPISVALLQGNIAQDMKWEPEVAQKTLDDYLAQVSQAKAKLIVMPETALPLLIEQVPADYLQKLKEHASKQQGDILMGAVEYVDLQYFNSMLSIGSAENQAYRKSHLVPFGEYIPLKEVFGWIYRDWLHIPLTDLARGTTQPLPMHLAGQQVAVNICYEDVFGEEVIRQLPQATLLVNASNDAWYGESLAAHQHLQMSQTRALETGRMMLRATNTGATAIISPHGEVVAELPHFTKATLEGNAQGYSGATPYVLWGNFPALVIIALGLFIGFRKKS